MKVSKRSLIVSIAVLCVCALSLASASFAWFSAVKYATITGINLEVSKASDLQISLDGQKWDYSFTSEFGTGLNDVSTDDAQAFAEPEYRDQLNADGTVKTGATYKTTNVGYIEDVVYFRSTKQDGVTKSVKMSGDEFAVEEGNNKINTGMRVAAIGDSTVFFGNGEGQQTGCIDAETLAVSATQPTLVKITNGEIIVTLGEYNGTDITDADNDYYVYGKATIRYWIEGTDSNVNNANAGVTFEHNLKFELQEA